MSRQQIITVEFRIEQDGTKFLVSGQGAEEDQTRWEFAERHTSSVPQALRHIADLLTRLPKVVEMYVSMEL